ncbi:histidine kinase [Paenibacillus albiflavus]|uniref:Signal transduction histidine-protein kinase/phosphatase DegS n=1 Tax=Paenibacillus albiflavus TaxID=2545760 RepID=A0A4R4EAF4_9BACL|nr:sensor histidine kinase [Paenibacillus albiflavus]TCZ76834.1 histidine kinase [Paenibacillus albiflavus]
MQYDAIDRVIKSAIEVMESSKYQIYEIVEAARFERESLMKELEDINRETNHTIDQVDKLEAELRRSRMRLSEVSRDFKKFNEPDIKQAYDGTNMLQLQLTIAREKENHLRVRRNELQKRLKNTDKQIERTGAIGSQMNVVLEYLSGDLTQVTRILESAKNRQMLGLQIILAQEEERKRIAREIHDGMAQTLANVVLRSEIAERLLAKEDYSVVKAELKELKGQVRGGLEDVRKLIFNLRPMALDDLGLVPTLRKFTQDYEEKTRIRTKFEFKGKETRLPSGMEVAIFRLMQEAFSNVYKHSKATFAELEITYDNEDITIKVMDNGVGFYTERMEQKLSNGNNFGLLGMRERLDLLEGSMTIESVINEGTTIKMVIPIRRENKEDNKDG